ncbi:NAD(P)-dependent oxidoreductase [Candidatus Williamhamiltonella defendens]|uniref:NAD(P)-dependent oxidoreductase n=1 Tax=Candidatus Williamhamiltonella defendens TaxID=138072 RepID=UPI00192D0855
MNTSRGEIVDTSAIITALKSQQLGGLVIDVHERGAPLFFQDHSSEIIDDDVFQCFISFPNVIKVFLPKKR